LAKRFGFLVSESRENIVHSRETSSAVLRDLHTFFASSRSTVFIELPFRQIFFLYSLRNRKIAEIIQSQDHHAFAELHSEGFFQFKPPIHNKTVCEQLMKRKKRETSKRFRRRKTSCCRERKTTKREQKINFDLSKSL
jgi:hypothetical protein